MKKIHLIKSLPAAVLLLLLSLSGKAQLVSCNAFLQGNYIEVGINTLGSYGSSTAAPAGYHPRGGSGVYNTCTGTSGPSGTNLGFVADPNKDGWAVGTPNYIGDYFLPGSPYEGWMIEVNGSKMAQNNGASSSLGSITSVTNSGQIRSATWQGSYAGLSIKQVTSFDINNLFFTCKVTLKNTTAGTLSNVYYLRGVDPDNEQPLTGNFTTNNAIVYQLPNSFNATLVSGTGQTHGAYLGLGTLDLRARCYITPSWPPSQPLSTVYAGASGITYSGTNVGDYGMGIVFNMGNIAPGDSTSFVFTYILKGSDFLAALLATSSGWSATGDTAFAHESGDTANICQDAFTTVTVSNPSITSWTWTSLSGETLSATTGSSVSLTTGTTLVRLMAVGTGSGPSETVYINLNPVFATPATPTASSNSPICQNTALNLTGSGGGSGITYKWSGPSGYFSTLQNPTISNAQVTASGVYSLQAANGACLSTAATTAVVVNTLPTISAGSSVSICNGSSTTLTATGGVSYTWAPAGSLSASTGSSVTASPTATTAYTVTGTNSVGCTNKATKSVLVNPLPASIGGTPSMCPGTTTTLTNAVSGGTWNSSNTSVATVGSTTGIVTGVSAGTATISYTLTNGCGTATVTVTVDAPPSVAATTGNASVFAGYTTTLSNATAGGTWSSGNTAVATINASGVVTGVTAGTALITYSVAGTCVARVFTTVNVLSCDGNANIIFNHTGANQTWTVPDGITSVTVTVTGASGGAAYFDATYGNHAGRGGRVTAALAVTPGQVLNLFVGGKGANFTNANTASIGGFNGGSNGGVYGYYSGAGGGASDIRVGGTSLTDRVIVAGGGGANGYGYSGAGNGGDGGNATGGTGGTYPTSGLTAATGGTQTAGGTGGTHTSGALYTGAAGSLGQGGTAAHYYGGGAGGGYYGGGGGAYLSAGGGGSSYANTSVASAVSFVQGVNPNAGQIVVSFPQSLISITAHPSDITTCSGTTATFSVAASLSPAAPALTYQWQVNSGSGFTDISGANSSTYGFTAATGDNGNQYRCIVNGVCSQTATSDAATLTVIGVPEITVCPSDVTVSNATGNCNANVTYSAATVTGTSPTVTYSHASGSSFNVGTTEVTVSASNTCGTVTCSFDVTVNDDEAPSITAPSNITVNNDAGNCSAAVASLGTPTTGDNCEVASVTNDHASATYSVGTTTVTWTVTDIHGNANTATQTVTVNDNESPVAICQNYTLNLSGGTGTVGAASIDNGSSDNCGIASMSVSPNTFTCANAGANAVTLTVTDVHGNTATCSATVTVQYQPSCSISVTPANSTYTGGVANNIYLGYGPQSATLTANATGGSGFSYSWAPGTYLNCTNCQSPVFTPTAAGTYVYTVTVTNSNGCSTTCVVSMCVIDARDPSHSSKVILCHVPPGNPSNPQTLSISPSAVPAHLTNHTGDRLGACSTSCGTAAKMGQPQPADIYDAHNLSIVVYPNPFSSEISVDVEGEQNAPVDIVLYDMTGRVMQYLTNQSINTSVKVGSQLPAGMYILEVKQNDISKKVKVTKL